MTITVSISAAGDALFGLLGPQWYQSPWKFHAEFAAIILLVLMNLRGVKESVQALLPIFLLFLLTHFILIVGSMSLHATALPALGKGIAAEVSSGLRNPNFGLGGMLGLLFFAYSLGAGTYTGIEAVSNSMPVMREPRVATAKRTMLYMACSLAFVSSGLMIAYLLLNLRAGAETTQTLNNKLADVFVHETGLDSFWLGRAFVLATLVSEGALLFVAAQAGFIDGPRVLANMVHDSWVPRWFSNLSERLATNNGIMLIGLFALGALLYTSGDVYTLVVMYSMNVFLTFSLSMIGMCRHWIALREENLLWRRRLALFSVGATVCVSILSVAVYEKVYVKLTAAPDQREYSGLATILVTAGCVGLCFLIHRYYVRVGANLRRLDEMLGRIGTLGEPNMAEPDSSQPAAVILVGSYSSLGIHTMLNAIRFAPGYFRSFVFVSVGVIDSGNFKGSGAVKALEQFCEKSLTDYVDLGRRLGMPSASLFSVGTDAVDELERNCLDIARKFPKSTFFAGQLVFQRDTWLHRLLHNQTAYSLQRRLQWVGVPMVILPTRVCANPVAG